MLFSTGRKDLLSRAFLRPLAHPVSQHRLAGVSEWKKDAGTKLRIWA
ncbi:hypothetical protein SS05631_b61500 (plasmid) [Sinorhizobium sp. CCBAU 05631]|nr:hypothetical protein SS05631_b61500 [Sinorhizobium sp. CCBAU 05631]